MLQNTINKVRSFAPYFSSLERGRANINLVYDELGVPLGKIRNDLQTIEDLAEVTGRTFFEITDILSNHFRAPFVKSINLTKLIVSSIVDPDLNILFEKGYAIHFNHVDAVNILVTSNIKDLFKNELEQYGMSVGLTTKKAYEEYCLNIYKFRDFISSNRIAGRNWINVLALCLLDASNFGARDVYLGMESVDGYRYVVGDKEYSGAIDGRVISQLRTMIRNSSCHVSLFNNIYPIGLGKCFLNSYGKECAAVVTFDIEDEVRTSNLRLSIKDDDSSKTINHLLLIDDDQRFLELLKRGISGKGFRVSSAVSANDALLYHLSSESSIDLVITDLHLPKFGGLDLVRAIKSRRPNLPIIVLTSDFSTDSYVEIVKAGADVVVNKEDDSRILIAWIKRLLNNKAEILERQNQL